MDKHFLLNKPNVVGYEESLVSRFRGGVEVPSEKVVRVYVSSKVSFASLNTKDLVPSTVDDVPTDVIEFNPVIFPPGFRQQDHELLQGGISVAHKDVTAGTLGAVVRGVKGRPDAGTPYILSNNHVIANSVSVEQPQRAKAGDAIYQPGPYDIRNGLGREPVNSDIVASLTRYIPFSTSRSVTADAAIAKITAPFLDGSTLGMEDIVYLSSPQEAVVGDAVRKSGRTTDVTKGSVIGTSGTFRITYDSGTVELVDQIVIKSADGVPFALGGDSGSLIVKDGSSTPVGLLFASDGQSMAIANKIKNVLRQLAVNFRTSASEIPDPIEGTQETPDVPETPVSKFGPSSTSIQLIILNQEQAPKDSILQLVSLKGSYLVGENVYLKAILTDKITGVGLSSRKISFSSSTSSTEVITDVDGVSSFSLIFSEAGTKVVTASFSGD